MMNDMKCKKINLWSVNAGILLNVNLAFFCLSICSEKNVVSCGVMLHLKTRKQKTHTLMDKKWTFCIHPASECWRFLWEVVSPKFTHHQSPKTCDPHPQKKLRPPTHTHSSIDLSDFYCNYNSAFAEYVACCTCNSTCNKIKKRPAGKILVTFWCLELEIRLNWPNITYRPQGH